MAQQKQRQGGFRFSLPSWMSDKAAPRPAPSQALVVESRSTPKQSPNSSPSQQTPPRAQPSKDIESQKLSPLRGSTQPPIVEPQSSLKQSPRVSPSQNLNQQQTPPRAQPSKDVESKRPSPSRASTQPRATKIQPPSPSLSGTQFRATSKTQSPSQTRAPTQPPSPSPSPATKKPRPNVTQLPSPPRVDPQPNSPSRTIHEAKGTLESTLISRSPPKTSLTVPTANRDEMNVVGSNSDVDEKGDKKKQTLVGKLEEMMKGKVKVQEHNHITSDSNERSKSEVDGKGHEKNKTLVRKLEETIKGKGKVQEHNHITSHSNERSKSEVDEKDDEKNHKFVRKLEEMVKGKGKAPETSHSNDIHVNPLTGSKELNVSHNLASNDGKTLVEEEDVNIKAALNPASSTKEFLKSVIPELVDKDRESVSHHKHTKLNKSRPLHKGIQDDISNFTDDHQKVPLDGTQVSVITLQGENRGASMVLGSELGKREKKINIHRGYKLNPHESIDSTTEGEKSPNEASSKNPERQEDEESKAYINSNIQSVNNSIMFNSSIAERNPGVHFATTSLKTTKLVHDTKSTEPLEANKTILRIAQSQNLTPKPAIRRRCLKGLLMESSDSDPENPNKPRRHGCRAACGEKSTKNKIDVL